MQHKSRRYKVLKVEEGHINGLKFTLNFIFTFLNYILITNIKKLNLLTTHFNLFKKWTQTLKLWAMKNIFSKNIFFIIKYHTETMEEVFKTLPYCHRNVSLLTKLSSRCSLDERESRDDILKKNYSLVIFVSFGL